MEYKYAHIPLDRSICRDLIFLLYADRTVQRSELVSTIAEYHASQGGVLDNRNLVQTMKKTLSSMQANNEARNVRFGTWRIGEKPNPNKRKYKLEKLQSGIVYVYYLECYRKNSESDKWLHKIGYTGNPLSERMSYHNTSSPETPQLVLTIESPFASSIEKMLHGILRLRGQQDPSSGREWFYTNTSEILDICKFIGVKDSEITVVSSDPSEALVAHPTELAF